MTAGKEYHVFLSHSSRDKPFVRRLATELESRGVKVWRDEIEMSIGDSLFDHVAKGIEKAEYFAIVLSNYSNESKWVRNELKAALNRELDEGRTFVIPILIENVENPTFLGDKIYADFRSEDRFDLSLQSLLKKFGVDDKDFASIENQGNKGKPAKPYPAPRSQPRQPFFAARQYVFAGAAIILLMAAGFGYYFWQLKRTVPGPAVKRTLGVLPFVNSSQDPNAEYLSHGLTESIINKLSQLSGLKVKSRNSSFRFKNSQTDEKNIAAQLGVETLITGDIRQVGDNLVINVRLIDAGDDSQIWGNQYVRSLNDIFTTQNEIAQAVAQNLRLKLSNTETELLRKSYTENVEAYQHYIRGRFYTYKLTASEIQKGILEFEQAIAIDPNYAPAYTGLADAYRSLAMGSDMSPSEFLPRSKDAAQRAIQIDDGYSEGHSALAVAIFWGEWDWPTAEKEFVRAIELDPYNSNAHIFYAHLLSSTGRHEHGLAEARTARELDPAFPFVNALEGQFLIHAERSDEGLARLAKTFDLDPNFWMPHLFAASAYIEKGMYAEAVAEARKARELSAAQTHSYSFESYALAKWGKTGDARAVIDELLKISKERWVPPYHIAIAYNGLNDTDNTLAWLERGFQQHDPKMAFLKVEPKWNNLRSDPRFAALIRKMNLSNTL